MSFTNVKLTKEWALVTSATSFTAQNNSRINSIEVLCLHIQQVGT